MTSQQSGPTLSIHYVAAHYLAAFTDIATKRGAPLAYRRTRPWEPLTISVIALAAVSGSLTDKRGRFIVISSGFVRQPDRRGY
jgi:hypothetical protein